MTEKEAKNKWCFMYRCSTDNGQLTDNATHGVAGYCCTSECMAWRYTHPEYAKADKKDNELLSGYCGLAGKP